MNVLRSALFAAIFYPVSVLAVLAALPAALLGRRAIFAVVHFWVWSHRWCAELILGIRTRVEGSLPSGAVLVAGKHQSMYETIEVVRLLEDPAVVLKRELADLPGWGRAAQRYGMIPVDRDGGAPALRRMLAAAQAILAEGRPIVIFPEGTRVMPGEQPPLQPGFAGLYKALGVPVVPVAIDSGLVWPRRAWIKRPGIVTFRFGDPIPPGLPRKEAEARVHAAINELDKSPLPTGERVG
jgi:1-acyl-sn-glycerol-3-phosphate acyltransferase